MGNLQSRTTQRKGRFESKMNPFSFDYAWLGLTDANPEIAFWTIGIGALCAVSCSILGCFLVLRRMSLLGDAISHAILPGLVIAYLMTGKMSVFPMFLGAMIVGVLTAALTQTLAKYGAAYEDSSMGIVFSALFATGVILIHSYARNTDLDADCVLYGDIVLASVDYAPFPGGWEVPWAIQPLGIAFLATVGFVALFWKELKIASFDPALAAAMGLAPALVHYLLMGMTAAVTVASFEAVGSILVIAMLIIPAATAQLLTDRLSRMILCASIVGCLSAIIGYWLAHRFETSVAGMMAVAAAGQFTLATLFAPRQGLVGKWLGNASIGLRIAGEDLLALLYRAEEKGQPGCPKDFCRKALGASWSASLAIPWQSLTRRVVIDYLGTLRLTDSGRLAAQSLIRTHRLWESYLDQNFELPLDHLHNSAERVEHYIGPALQEELAKALDDPSRDPHGRQIPVPTPSSVILIPNDATNRESPI